MRGSAGRDSQSPWVEAALRVHEDRNLTRVTVARSVMFATIWFYLLFNYGPAVALENLGVMALFVAFGLAIC